MALRDPLQYARDMRWAALEQYVPTWTGSGGNPVIGNGTIVGRYRREGATAFLRGAITIGSSTTLGTGTWAVSLPTGWAGEAQPPNGFQQGQVMLLDAGVGVYEGLCYVNPSGTVLQLQVFNTAGTYAVAVGASATVPFSWAATDSLSWNIVMELD